MSGSIVRHDAAGGSRVIGFYRSTTDTLSAPTIGTTETVFATKHAFPAGYFVAGRLVRISAYFDYVATAVVPTSAQRARLTKAGPTSVNLFASAATAMAASAVGVSAIYMLQGTAAAGASVAVECGADNALSGVRSNTINSGQNVDTSAAQTFEITHQFSAATAGNSITLRQLIVEELG